MRESPRAVLALDQAKVSGVALTSLAQRQVLAGVYSGTEAMQRAVTTAVELAGDPRALWVVYEDHSKIPAAKAGNTATILGMGDARGAWHTLLDLAGVPRANRTGVAMSDWRARDKTTVRGWRSVVLHVTGRHDREAWKRIAIAWAQRRYRGVDLSADAAEAACILEWALLTRPWEATCRAG